MTLTDLLAFCEFSFGADIIVSFRNARPCCEPCVWQICLFLDTCSQSQRGFLFGGNYARFAVGHSDTTFWIGLTLASSIEE